MRYIETPSKVIHAMPHRETPTRTGDGNWFGQTSCGRKVHGVASGEGWPAFITCKNCRRVEGLPLTRMRTTTGLNVPRGWSR